MDPITVVLTVLKKIPAKFWAALAVSAVIALTYLYIGYLKNTIESQKKDIATLQEEKKAAEDKVVLVTKERDDLRGHVDEQNLEIKKYRQRGIQLQKELDAATKIQIRKQEEFERNIADLKKVMLPVVCEEAIKWQSIQMLRFEEEYRAQK